jgi:hypothetical protein
MDTNEAKVVRAGPEDLIATMWFSLGFKPTESLILAGLEGPRHRIGVILRVDLPGPTVGRSQLRELIRAVIGPIVASPAKSVVAVVATERALVVPPPQIVSVLKREVRNLRLNLFDVLGVTTAAYRSLICRDHRCCPREGKAIEAVMSSKAAAVHVYNGDRLVETEDDLVADVSPEPTPPFDAHTDGGASANRASGPAVLALAERHRWWTRWMEVLELSAKSNGPPLSGLSGALHDPFLRDALLMHLLGACDPQVMAMLEGRDAASDDPDLADPDVGVLLARPPDGQRISSQSAVLAGAARVAVAGDRAPCLAMLALLAWYEGNGSRSRVLAERARADFPALSLTALVEDLLIRGTPPPWLRLENDRHARENDRAVRKTEPWERPNRGDDRTVGTTENREKDRNKDTGG